MILLQSLNEINSNLAVYMILIMIGAVSFIWWALKEAYNKMMKDKDAEIEYLRAENKTLSGKLDDLQKERYTVNIKAIEAVEQNTMVISSLSPLLNLIPKHETTR